MGIGGGRPAKPLPRAGLGQGRAVGGGAPGPGGSAGAMAPGGPSPTPWSSKAQQIVAGAQRKYLNEIANFDLAEQTAKQDFGLDPGFNDYKANPYSRAALLEQSYLNQNRGTVNSAGLQLYAGSTSNALGSNRRVYGENRDYLQKAYSGALGEISAGRAQAAQEQAEAQQQAEWEAIAAAEGAPLSPETAPGGKGKKQKQKKPKGPGIGPGKPAKK